MKIYIFYFSWRRQPRLAHGWRRQPWLAHYSNVLQIISNTCIGGACLFIKLPVIRKTLSPRHFVFAGNHGQTAADVFDVASSINLTDINTAVFSGIEHRVLKLCGHVTQM